MALLYRIGLLIPLLISYYISTLFTRSEIQGFGHSYPSLNGTLVLERNLNASFPIQITDKMLRLNLDLEKQLHSTEDLVHTSRNHMFITTSLGVEPQQIQKKCGRSCDHGCDQVEPIESPVCLASNQCDSLNWCPNQDTIINHKLKPILNVLNSTIYIQSQIYFLHQQKVTFPNIYEPGATLNITVQQLMDLAESDNTNNSLKYGQIVDLYIFWECEKDTPCKHKLQAFMKGYPGIQDAQEDFQHYQESMHYFRNNDTLQRNYRFQTGIRVNIHQKAVYYTYDPYQFIVLLSLFLLFMPTYDRIVQLIVYNLFKHDDEFCELFDKQDGNNSNELEQKPSVFVFNQLMTIKTKRFFHSKF